MSVALSDDLAKNFVLVHWHALLFVMPVCILMINRRSRSGVLRLLFRIRSWAYGTFCSGYAFPTKIFQTLYRCPCDFLYCLWDIARKRILRKVNRQEVVKSVSQVFGQYVADRNVVPFSDENCFSNSTRIPAYALMERRSSKPSIISIQEAKRRSVAVDAIKLAEEDESLVPELEKPSNLLDEKTLLSLCKHLPNRCVGYSWSPIYTTYDHGTSLRTLYRNMANMDAPVVLIIQDSNENIFGALCSNSLHVSDHYYGTGESFLFTLKPNFEVFKWTGENSFFIKGDTDALAIGGGKGTFGLWLDGDLYRGCSHTCDTFRNKVLSSEEDFEIQSIEVWLIKDM